ncbi:hypothetical protein RSAG8_05462, partial [Rhizoctonia solani AG-8 WAC10335]
AGPLPAADFSFGAPEPGHGDAFNRVMNMENSSGEFNPQEYHSQEYTTEFAGQMWDARTRFGSMASIASDVTGVSVSSTQATSVSGGLGTATFNNTEFECPQPSYGYPNGFQPDLRRASCPGEFLHQFSGMGVASPDGPCSAPVRPSPLGRSLTIAPDSRGLAMINDAKSLRSPTFPPGQVDPTYPPPPPEQEMGQPGQGMSGQPGQGMSPSQQPMLSPPNQMSPSNQPMHSPSNQPMISSPSQGMMTPDPTVSQQHLAQTTLSPSQRSLVGGGFGNGYEQGYEQGYVNGQDGYGNGNGQDGGYVHAPDAQTNHYAPDAQHGGYADAQNGGYAPESQTGGYAPESQTGGYTPEAQTNGYTNDPSGYPTDSHPQPYIHTPPSYETSPNMGGVPVLGPASNMEIVNLNKDRMLFAGGYNMMMNQEYPHTEFSAYS